MMTLGIILTALLLLDALRLRQRILALKHLPGDLTAESDADFCLLTAAGVQVDAETRQKLAAYANQEGLDVVDLVPGRWHALGLLSLAQLIEPTAYRAGRLVRGRTAGYGVLVRRNVLERMEHATEDTTLDATTLINLARTLKLYACTTTDFVVVPQLDCRSYDLGRRRVMLQATMGGMAWVVLIAQPLILAGIVVFAIYQPIWGGMTLATFHLQPLVAMAGSKIRTWDLGLQCLLRTGVETYVWAATVFTGERAPESDDPVPALRPTYEALVADGLGPFFEERRTTCPLCDSDKLGPRLKTTDIIQRKPGKFVLDQCGSCDHIFQNPRLSIDGLNYYYKDFYDGLGEAGLDTVFGYSPDPYLARARMLKGAVEPSAWLDVGAGHGHFCCVAKEVWPDTRFDALDLSESVDEAARRRWTDAGHRGLFPEMAHTISNQYDVVSMSHYLEHTRDPVEEVEAARTALKDGGIVFIEVPDPECVLGRLLGRYWVPWFQPQHQHLLSAGNLKTVLEKSGFEIVQWHHGQAHQAVDFLFATYLQVNRFAPPHNYPWTPPLRGLRRFAHHATWILGLPWIALGWFLDRCATPIMQRARHSNTYRVTARKV